MNTFVKTDDILKDMRGVIESSQKLRIRQLIQFLFGEILHEISRKNLTFMT